MSMDGNDKLEASIREAAGRLRLIQVDFADESEQTRREYLSEETERALKGVLPEQRKDFLERLLLHFPTGSFVSETISSGAAAARDSSAPVERLRDPEFLVQSLVECSPELSDEQRGRILDSIGTSDEPASAAASCSERSAAKLMEALRLGADRRLNPDRLGELVGFLAEFLCRLEPLVWNTWRALSPRSEIRRSGELGKAMGEFICDGDGSSREEVEAGLKELQRLTAALITAISRAGGQFAKNHMARFSPSEIASLVKMERGSVLVSHEVKCWRKYTELAETLNEDAIDTEIRRAIVSYVESLMKGMGR